MRLLIVTDSLGMPRIDVPFNSVWTRKIIEEYREKLEIITQLQRSLTSRQISIQRNEIALIEPDIVIVQVGIVDCTRRAMPDIVRPLFGIPGINTIIHYFAQKYHYELTKTFEFELVNIEEFSRNISDILTLKIGDSARSPYFIIIAIAPPSIQLTLKVYGIGESIRSYNEVLRKASSIHAAKFIDPYVNNLEEVDMFLLQDGHHLNISGHALVYESVNKAIDEIIDDIGHE